VTLDIKCYPDPVLKRACRPVRTITDNLVRRAREMLEFMYEADGIGLAACQVGWSNRIVTIDVELDQRDPRIFVNPLITEREGEQELEEGCLSLPGLRLKVPRAERVKVVAYTLEGRRLEIEAEGLAACAWQHELDHLNGLLIVDRVPPTTLIGLRDQLKRLEEAENATAE
jgi:peptide deformylase